MALTDNLQAYWKLDETSGTRVDETANNNDLTDNNTVLYGTGKISNAADFELSNSEYLSITHAAQTGLNLTSDFSFSFWVKVEQLPTTAGTTFNLFSKDAVGSRGYGVAIESGSDKLWIDFLNNSPLLLSRIASDAAIITSGDVGNWVHIAGTVDISVPSGVIYKNGSSVASTPTITQATSMDGSTAKFTIGNWAYNDTQYFDGLMDESGIWSRILTGTEVGELYNGGAGLAYPLTPASPFTPRMMVF